MLNRTGTVHSLAGQPLRKREEGSGVIDGLISDCMGIQLNYVVISGQFFTIILGITIV